MRLLTLFCLLGTALSAQDAKPDGLTQDVEKAIKGLVSEKHSESRDARTELIEIGRKAIPHLVKALRAEDSPVQKRHMICEVLGKIRDKLARDDVGRCHEHRIKAVRMSIRNNARCAARNHVNTLHGSAEVYRTAFGFNVSGEGVAVRSEGTAGIAQLLLHSALGARAEAKTDLPMQPGHADFTRVFPELTP